MRNAGTIRQLPCEQFCHLNCNSGLFQHASPLLHSPIHPIPRPLGMDGFADLAFFLCQRPKDFRVYDDGNTSACAALHSSPKAIRSVRSHQQIRRPDLWRAHMRTRMKTKSPEDGKSTSPRMEPPFKKVSKRKTL